MNEVILRDGCDAWFRRGYPDADWSHWGSLDGLHGFILRPSFPGLDGEPMVLLRLIMISPQWFRHNLAVIPLRLVEYQLPLVVE